MTTITHLGPCDVSNVDDDILGDVVHNRDDAFVGLPPIVDVAPGMSTPFLWSLALGHVFDPGPRS